MTAAEAHTAQKRNAVRILFILDQCGSDPGRDPPEDAVGVIKAEKRLQALDFWVRNPDYLAAELLTLFETSRNAEFFHAADQVMGGDEPEIRRLGMLRFLFGAWEQIDDAMATLESLGLAKVRKSVNREKRQVQRTDFFLLRKGRELGTQLVDEAPLLRWYRDRAALVASVAGNDSGNQLKKRQYVQAEYQGAKYGDMIVPIKERVLARLAKLREEAA
ncbi:hypothetical protein VY88_24910 [Azospirillum thiophilum]|uniref:Uncharacterized protein n=1 Tax=Azospirillum thiophilum TaxID=528244 RepID=A0AAC8W5A2_9PROT|nr:hypothetical protein [Azospirillum thiophilum]ALG75316.1 hypothetical protein AL072_30920 [Azospirillum thiophilum]KJR62231.1 hypothetical protein VY88_24910 [Azospirillum thiophilum]